ncbi:hypothetical protein ElP_52360 [Tautonia plasticadhaerens]|uniref:Xylose isomerase-like TIM barrel n=1 Tax=Tautonia plasticadhaerens TaxID=2527974 RepID=A0A518H8Z9_9BACT|nr:hypothetical protein ElP_52360 [Tautonia plasticadhaerens]
MLSRRSMWPPDTDSRCRTAGPGSRRRRRRARLDRRLEGRTGIRRRLVATISRLERRRRPIPSGPQAPAGLRRSLGRRGARPDGVLGHARVPRHRSDRASPSRRGSHRLAHRATGRRRTRPGGSRAPRLEAIGVASSRTGQGWTFTDRVQTLTPLVCALRDRGRKVGLIVDAIYHFVSGETASTALSLGPVSIVTVHLRDTLEGDPPLILDPRRPPSPLPSLRHHSLHKTSTTSRRGRL